LNLLKVTSLITFLNKWLTPQTEKNLLKIINHHNKIIPISLYVTIIDFKIVSFIET